MKLNPFKITMMEAHMLKRPIVDRALRLELKLRFLTNIKQSMHVNSIDFFLKFLRLKLIMIRVFYYKFKLFLLPFTLSIFVL